MSRVPTLVLKSIDIAKLARRYNDGNFKLDVKKLKKFPRKSNAPTIISKDTTAAVYSSTDKYNQPLVYTSSGYESYQIYTTNGDYPPVGGFCPRCGRTFTTPALGIPLQTRYFAIDENGTTIGTQAFWCEETCYCSTLCVFGVILDLPKECESENAETLIKFLHSLMHPGKELHTPPERRLYKMYGGSLDPEDVDITNYCYKRTTGVTLAPLKVKYLREKV